MQATQQPIGWEQAHKACLANVTPRYHRLEELERWVAGTQYQGRKDWFDDSVALWERAPCIVYPVAHIAIQSYVDLLFGEGRFPTFLARAGEDEEDDEGLDEDDSATLERFLSEHHRLSRFRAYCREALFAAMSTGTTVGVHGVRNGKPFAEALPAKWCTPRLGVEREVLSLDIRYPYVEEYKQPDGKWAVRAKLYRRVINADQDITFLPADAREDGVEPTWTPDPQRTVNHALGFAPVVWYALLRGCAPVNQIDGHAIHELLLDEIQQHDIALSQRHRCALLSEPQICEIGVQPGYSPTASAPKPAVPATMLAPAPVGPGNPAIGGYDVSTPMARKKGPGNVWQYPNPETKVSALTIGSDALKAQDDNARDLRMKLQEALGVVLLDPESIKFASTTSGKALEAIKQRQVDRCDQYRDDLAENFLLPSVHMQLRIAQKLGSGAVKVPGLDKAMKVLDGMVTAES